MAVPPEKKSVATLLNSNEGLQWRKVHHGQARLESTRRSSIILAAFSFSVFSSLQLNFPSNCPQWMMTLLAVNSAVLVSMHSSAFIISTFLLPKLQAVSEEYVHPNDGDKTMRAVPEFSPHDRFRGFVELSYNISHILGLFLFLLEIALIAWVKFWDVSIHACIVSSAIILPFMIAFGVFCWHFHRTLSTTLYHTRAHLLQDVEREYARSEETLFTTCSPSTARKDVSQESLYSHFFADMGPSTRQNSDISLTPTGTTNRKYSPPVRIKSQESDSCETKLVKRKYSSE